MEVARQGRRPRCAVYNILSLAERTASARREVAGDQFLGRASREGSSAVP